jgi:hypothetical protein
MLKGYECHMNCLSLCVVITKYLRPDNLLKFIGFTVLKVGKARNMVQASGKASGCIITRQRALHGKTEQCVLAQVSSCSYKATNAFMRVSPL